MADEVHRTGAGNDPAAKPVCGTPRAERPAAAVGSFLRWGKVMWARPGRVCRTCGNEGLPAFRTGRPEALL